jgi:RNA polymerase sigma factor (sigma-70 family)
MKINELIVNYKQTKNQKNLEEIFKLLQSTLKNKIKFVYFNKWYSFNIYIKCKYCQNCKHNKELQDRLKEMKRRELCEECNDCICSKGYFNLKKNNLCEYKDVEQDLNLEILKLIDSFDVEIGDFNSYLFSSLWDWRPSFITLDFVESINHNSLFKMDEAGEEQDLNVEDKKSQEKIKSNLNIEDILNKCETVVEKNICELLLENPNLSQDDLAKKLGTYKMDISRIIKKLRKRLKIFVTK